MKKHINNPIALLLIFFTLYSNCYAQKETPIKVMTTNIRYASPNDGINIWENRRDWLCQSINFYDIDILGAQEVIHSQLKDMVSRLSDYNHVGIGRNGGNEGEFCPVFYKKSKYDQLEYKTFWLSETPDMENSKGWDAALPRIVTWVKMKDKETNKEFYFFNTHFDHKGEKARLESAKLLIKKAKEIAGKVPFFITGDFNFSPDVEAYSVLTTKNELNFKLKDSKLEAKETYGPEYTFNGFKLEPDQNKKRIDYIFFNNAISINKHHVIDGQRGPSYISDHFPIVIEAFIK